MRLAAILLTVAAVAAAARAEAPGAAVELFVTDTTAPQDLSIKPVGGQPSTAARLFASPGEAEPFSFALRPHVRLAQVMIAAGDLTGDAGQIPAARLTVRSVGDYHGKGRDVLIELGTPWDMAAWSKELFWVTVHVPADARPGVYRGPVTVTAESKPVATLDLEVEVLPIALEDPPWALGYNYSSPKNPAALAAHLADMREHGMTVVAPLYNFHLPIHDDDTSEFGAFIDAYAKAGFRQPLYFATPMELTLGGLTGYGPIDSKRFQQKYIEVMRKLHAEAQRHPAVPVFFSIGDELTNKGVRGVEYAGKLARFVYEELPELAITSDMNGYKEVMAMAPWLNVATFNNGWDGIDRHNQGRRLINRDFLTEVRKTGAIPWFVNAQSGRFPFGFFFWKMARYGVRGKVEWYWCLGKNEKGSVVQLAGGQIRPTLDYENSREGIDDLRYVVTLERLVAKAKAAGRAPAETAAAEALLAKIADSIRDDWTAYTQGGETFPLDGFDPIDPARQAQVGQFNALRRAVVDRILALQKAMKS